MIKVCFVCHGNICRSTMAEFVMQDMLQRTTLNNQVTVFSRGCSAEETGCDTHYRTKETLEQYGIPIHPHRAQKISSADYAASTYVIGMDRHNIRDLKRLTHGDPQKKISLLLSYAGEERDIRDPWYTGDFEETYRDVKKGCEALLKKLVARYGLHPKI